MEGQAAALAEQAPAAALAASAPDDDGRIMQIAVHRTDRLKPDIMTCHPLVRVHFVDENTGAYLRKQSAYAVLRSY